MTAVTIPATLEEMTKALGGLERLLTATKWERAAIVYAFTRKGVRGEGGPGRPKSGKPDFPLTFVEFAALKIKGLTDQETVAEYHAAWQRAVDDGWAEKAKPGKTVALPSQKWPGRQDSNGQRRYVDIDSPGAVAKIVAQAKPAAIVDAIQAKGVGAEDQVFHELKLRRAGIDTSLANRKASNAAAHEVGRAMIRTMNQPVYRILVVSSLNEATAELRELMGTGDLTDEDETLIREALEEFQIAFTEAVFAK